MSQRCVLVVEDDTDSREAFADVLYEAGYVVLMAREGLTALELLQANEKPPDLMLLDIMMPELDGYALLSELGKSARGQIPTVVCSASEGPTKSWPNVRGFLRKPVQVEELIEVVRKCLADSPPRVSTDDNA